MLGKVVGGESTTILNSLAPHQIGYPMVVMVSCQCKHHRLESRGNTMNLKESWGISSGDPPTEKSPELYLCPYSHCARSQREGFSSSMSCLQPWAALGVRGPGLSVCWSPQQFFSRGRDLGDKRSRSQRADLFVCLCYLFSCPENYAGCV